MNFWQKTKRFLEPSLEFPFLVGMRIFSTLNTTWYSLLLAYFLQKIIHNLENKNVEDFIQTIVTASITMICFMIVAFLIRNYFWVEQQFRWDPFLYRKYLKKFIKLDPLKIESLGTGKILSILQKGIEELTLTLLGVITHSCRIISTIIFGIFFARQMPPMLIFGGIGIILIIFIAIVYLNKYTTFYRRQRKENNVKTTGVTAKIIMSKFEILQNNSVEKEIDKMDVISNYSRELARKQNLWGSFLFQAPKFFLSLIIVSCYYYFGMKVFGGSYLLSEMIGLLTILTLFEVTLRDSIEYYENFTKAFVHIEKLWDFMDNTPQIQGYDTGGHFHFKQGNFEMKNLGFSYNNSSDVLSQFSLSIQGGKRTALVGRSGSGKTTLMKLLAGYMRPTSGELLIDGQDISSIRLDSYYPHIGYLTQEPSVFDGTIEENLLYGMRDAPLRKGGRGDLKKQIKQAIELSECQFIYELEHGLQTEIGERGVRLSGGQKQRLAIAKIFLKNPEIILLDEPTAALDSYSEEKVARAFEHLFVGRTVIVIAHRLQTVKSADDIIVLGKGKVVERGTHRELLKLGGKYAGMVDLQSGVVREENNEESYEK